jgi:hypothetical protein
MQKLYILPFLLIAFSCKKKCADHTSTISLNETRWNLHYKNNTTFNFYAESELYFKQNQTVYNYRNFDTIAGNWNANARTVTLNFNNGDQFSGTAITSDSISGTLTAAGNNGVWYATRK